MALAIALPLLAVWLLVHERREQQDLAAARSQLLVHAVQRQAAERLELLSHELGMQAAQARRSAGGRQTRTVSPIPLSALRVQPGMPPTGAAAGAYSGLHLEAPVRDNGRWVVPVHQDDPSGMRVSGSVDASWFAEMVQGYDLADREMLDLVHEDRVLVARSQDNAANVGRSVERALLFQQPHLARMQGRYVGRSVVDGLNRQFVFGRIAGTPLIAVASSPQSAILLPWYAFAAVVLGLSLAMGGLWAWLMRLLARSQGRQGALVDELRHTGMRLQQAHALAAIGEYEWDLQTDQVRWSRQIYDIYGRPDTGAGLDSRRALEWVDPRDAQRVEASLEQLVCGTRPDFLEFRIHRPDGEMRWVQARGALVEDPDGRRYVRGFQQDVTELAQVRERLREAEAQYRFLFEHNPLPMWVYDRETLRLLAVNETAMQKYGYRREEFLAMTVLDVRPQEDRRRALAYIQNPPWPNDSAEAWRHVLKDGRVIHVNNTGVDIEFDGRPACLVLIRDITEQRRAEAEREHSEERFRLIARATSDAVYDFDAEDGTLWWSDSFYSTFGFSREDVPATLEAWEALVHPADRARVSGSLKAVMDSELSEWEEEYRFRCHDGRYAEVIDRGYMLRDASGRITRIVGGMLDVSERHRSEADLRLLRRAVEATSNGVIITDARQPDCPIVYVNPAFQDITGYAPEEVIGRNCRFLQRDDRDQIALESIRQALREQREVRVLLRNYRKDGTPFANDFHVAPVRDRSGELTHFVGVQNDVTERQRYEEQLAYRATHDELTGLPNRQLLLDRLQQAVLSAERYGRQVAVVFIDLDDFKLVNDSLGHSAGDDVLRAVAQRLREVVRGTDTVGRFGGDEFVIVLTEQTDDPAIADVLARIASGLTDPIELAGVSYTLTPSIGYCRYPDAGDGAEALLMRADVAMYQAKQQGRNRAVAYRPEFDAAVSRRLQMVSQLRDALRRQEFLLDFQPLFGVDDRPVALEALVRWHHPERGVLLPEEFVPVCEESGLIVELGRRVLAEAARHHAMLVAAGLGHLRIAVNVSAAQFAQDLHADIAEVIARFSLPRGVLELELTESVIMASPERAIRSMQQIVALGVGISIDDFGTGYSSLACLKRLPIERLKIDRSFVRDLGVDPDDALDLLGDHRPGALPGPCHRGRGRRDRAAARMAAVARMRRDPGIPAR
ncbi:MAG: PAS domain S-box protein [Pseudomonadota bacterium]|nr:PAS domain S-box protein [Pseudomonadota bacterium]